MFSKELPPELVKRFSLHNPTLWQREKSQRATNTGAFNTVEASRKECRSLVGFVKECWHVIHPTTRFINNWHIKFICEHLEAISTGRLLKLGHENRLRINMPPRLLKSELVSVIWPAWEWGPFGRPDIRYLSTTYREDYALRDSRAMRDLVESPWYQARWGNLVRLTSRGERVFENDAKGARRAVPFESLTGGGGDRVIIDDPHSVDSAESEADRERVIRRFRESVPWRLNDPEKSAIVLVMHRLHENDISGVIDRLKLPYTNLILPMEFEVDRCCETPLGRDPRRKEGELLFPDRWPREIIDRDKKATSDFAWASQMQQRPAPRGGSMFRKEWFPVVGAAPAVAKRVRAWDLAASKQKGDSAPSYTCGVRMARDNKGVYYVEDVVRMRESGETVESAIVNVAQQDRQAFPSCKVRLPQDPGAGGKSWAEYLARALAGFVVVVKRVDGAKITRAEPFASQAKAGNVRLVSGQWNEKYLDELCTFPSGLNDDQVDASSDAFIELALGSNYDTSYSWVR